MNAVLIDDDELNNELLQNLLHKYCPAVNVVGIADSVELALEVILNTRPDVLFVDIELHDLTVKDLLNTLDVDNMQVVIISAYDKYALEMHKYQLTDYLLKPLLITDLVSAVNKVQKNIDKLKQIEISIAMQNQNRYIALPEKKGEMNIIQIDQIMRLEAKGNYTTILTFDDKMITSTKTLGDYEDLLPRQQFVRAHNSHIVNIRYVSKYLKTKNGCLEMIDGTQIPISAQRKREVTERIVF
jgi:two-component system LytT family response regulator